jgi:hypothetical protein
LGYFQGAVGTGRIDHNDLLGNAFQGGQTIVQIGLFIASDEYD